MHVGNVYCCVWQPKSVNAIGLHECFSRALSHVGVDGPGKLVGFGCDGARVNIGERSLSGLLQHDRPCWYLVFSS